MNTISRLATAAFFSSLVLTSGCAHHRDVRPGADGVHRVLARGAEKEQVEQDAIKQANHFCKERNLSAAFVSEDTKYTGDMDESTRNTIRQASKAVGAVGSGMSVFGGNTEKNAGQVAMGAGAAGHIYTDDNAYSSDMKFKCQ